MGKVVQLTVHINKLEQRKRKALRKALKDSIHKIPFEYDSFVVVAFKRNDDSFDHYTDYVLDYPELLPMLPDMVKHYVLRAIMDDSDPFEVEDDDG